MTETDSEPRRHGRAPSDRAVFPPRPEDRDLPLDSHLHTDLSPDSNVPIDAYAALAVERGITELAITDHVDFEPGAPAYDFVPFETRERVVRDAAERWADRVAIRFGCEITYDRVHEEAIREHLARHRYDFTIGSVHIGVRSPFNKARAHAHIAGGRLQEVMAPYFDEVEAAARSGLFDTLGHLDVVKRYASSWIKPAAFAAAPELYEPTLRALVSSGTGLEVNTSGLRQAPRETYPAAWVVAWFRELGGTAVTTGSDAHWIESFGFGLGTGYRIAAEAGFGSLSFRRGDERVTIAIPDGRYDVEDAGRG
ncbi:MAG TPA: histidinol-phosphatase HisJ family protein [Candidatus Acidoferrum sp.]|nr:histidinol-phosphatase HisJ family protein [Candidatus Acidoferrum sp.]